MRHLKYWLDAYFDQLYDDLLAYPYRSPTYTASGGVPPGSKPPPGAERYRSKRELAAIRMALEALSQGDQIVLTTEHAPQLRGLSNERKAELTGQTSDQFRYRRKLAYNKLLQALPSFGNL